MNLDIMTRDHLTVVTMEETRLDAAIAARFKDRLREVIGRGADGILLDLRRVDFMDSSGLGAIIAIRKALPDGCNLTLANLTPNVERVFRLTHMDRIFHICATGDVADGGPASAPALSDGADAARVVASGAPSRPSPLSPKGSHS